MARRKIDLRTCFITPLLKITPELLHRIMGEVIEANAAFIENLNRAQLFDGKRPDGSDITPEYTETTEFIKKEKGQRYDRVTIHDTGATYESIFTEVFADRFELEADDPKVPELVAKYGDLFGLTEESKTKLIIFIKPQFIAKLKAAIGL
ncbi:hypothetical protein [Spirosoma foliorum]|uniref:Uncharacterized protein n=1 Tax=Spirosoma foliorum TaxID=2710596 RepID=A0A7G5H5I1_9BACT|nr:hypothetical protein [Spirosoma foliorum]QMW06373.1 hypothetical protein H3H32_16520 [Spirosoma foliorum]